MISLTDMSGNKILVDPDRVISIYRYNEKTIIHVSMNGWTQTLNVVEYVEGIESLIAKAKIFRRDTA